MAETTPENQTAPEPPTNAGAAGAPVGALETDRFCDRCGYNLRTQAVTRDERTGILICRCPECGTFHAAGVGTDAGRAWLGRFGTLLLLVWVLILFACGGAVLLGMGGLEYGHLDALTRYQNRVREATVNGQRMQRYESFRTLRTPPNDPRWRTRYASEMRWFVRIMVGMSVALGGLAGVMLVVFCWHLGRWAYRSTLVLPVLVGLFVYWIWTLETVELRGWGLERIGLHALSQCAGMAIGMRLGRPVVRFVLPFLLPASLLQHLAFLWHVDRKMPPAPSGQEGGPG